jgi:hypothetical protein
MTEPAKVWRYRSREQGLLQIVLAMWLELRKPASEQNPNSLDQAIRREGLAWALPSMAHIDDDELLTTAQLAERLGYAESTIRVWPSRHALPLYNGLFRWGDVDAMLRHRTEGNRTSV